jgi:hypothetical protein
MVTCNLMQGEGFEVTLADRSSRVDADRQKIIKEHGEKRNSLAL